MMLEAVIIEKKSFQDMKYFLNSLLNPFMHDFVKWPNIL